jgi:hypothetical protein
MCACVCAVRHCAFTVWLSEPPVSATFVVLLCQVLCRHQPAQEELGNVLAEDLLPGGGGKDFEPEGEDKHDRVLCQRDGVGHTGRGQKKTKMARRANFCMGARRECK